MSGYCTFIHPVALTQIPRYHSIATEIIYYYPFRKIFKRTPSQACGLAPSNYDNSNLASGHLL